MWDPNTPVKTYVSNDLHGKKAREAKKTVEETVLFSIANKADELTVITGRGKHINSNGTRGVLFKAFPKWIKMKSIAPLIKEVETNIGSYKLSLQKQLNTEPLLGNTHEDHTSALLKQLINKVGIKAIIEKVESGDLNAQGMLGYVYLTGFAGIKSDIKNGLELIEAAANKDEPISLMQLAVYYANGLYGLKKNPRKAVDYFRKVAEGKSKHAAEGQLRMGICYLLGQGVEQDDALAIKWFLAADESKHPLALHNLAICYAHGWGVEHSEEKAFQYYERAAKLNVIESQAEIAERYRIGKGVAQNKKLSIQWLEFAARLGHTESEYKLAQIYRKGPIDNRPRQLLCSLAHQLIQSAAEKDHVPSQVDLAWFYISTCTKLEDFKQGLNWLDKAIAQNDGSAYLIKGTLLKNGHRFLKNDDALAFQHLQKSAELGYTIAQIKLLEYWNALQNTEEQESMLQMIMNSARKGDQEAQYYLGNLLIKYSEQDEKCKKEALHLFTLAAKQEHLQAQIDLGEHYLEAPTSQENDEKAVYWYSQAAELGDPKSQTVLGCFYCNGEHGLAKDDNKAYMWFTKAAEQNFPQAKIWLAKIMIKSNAPNDKKIREITKLLESAKNEGSIEALAMLQLLSLKNDNKMPKNKVKNHTDKTNSAQSHHTSVSKPLIFSDKDKKSSEEDKSLFECLAELRDSLSLSSQAKNLIKLDAQNTSNTPTSSSRTTKRKRKKYKK